MTHSTAPHATRRSARADRTVTAALARHPWRTLLAVIAFVVLAGGIGGGVAGSLNSGGGFVSTDAESSRAEQRIEDLTGQQGVPGVVLLVDTDGGTAANADRLRDLQRRLAAESGVASVASPITAPNAGLASTDGSQALVAGTLSADADDDATADAVLAEFKDTPGVTVGGSAVINVQLGDTVGGDLARAEMFAEPILVVLSLFIFGARALILPLLVGGATVMGTFLVITGINSAYSMSVFALNLVIGLGLGLAIDYSLFLLTRFREEIEHSEVLPAVVTTMRTAGRTVLFSAATVAVAMLTLLVFPLNFVKSMGIAGAVVAVMAALAAVVIAPALFAVLGHRLARRRQHGSRWHDFAQLVMRRPAAFAGVTAAVMLILAAPALRAVWTPVDSSVIPKSQSSRTVADAMQTDFAGSGGTAVTVVVDNASADAAAGLRDRISALPNVASAAEPVQLRGNSWLIDTKVPGDPQGSAARDVVHEVRGLSDAPEALVGGSAAAFIDQQDALGGALPIAIAVLVLLTMTVLWLMTGSVILPVKAVVMNILTVGTALGVISVIYGGGHLTGLLNYTPNGGVEPTDFVVTAAVVFALSTDYGVFLLGRIKEVRDSGRGERESVAIGLQRTGAVVTAAAILLAVAIGAFSTSSISFIQQIGVATAFGVLVDAFVVRSFLVPSLMAMLGHWNWWSPAPLRRLHDRIGIREGDVALEADPQTDRVPG